MTIALQGSAVCWPTARQTLFLRACLADGDVARAAWARFRDGYDFDAAAGYEQFLAPLLARNLVRLGVNEPLLGRLVGLRRYHWLRNQALTRYGIKAAAVLAASHIDAMMMKGGAMFAAYYDDLGLRPMADLDLLVRKPQAADAFRALVAAGWKPAYDASADFVLNGAIPSAHAWTVVAPGGVELDLHWHVASEVRDGAFAAALWDAAHEGTLHGMKIRVPAPEHLLLITVLHGLRWSTPNNLRWIADLVEILTRKGAAMDAERLARTADGLRMIVPLRAALDYLARDLAIPVPAPLISAVWRVPTRRVERWAFATEVRHPAHRTAIGLSALSYQIRARESGGRSPRSGRALVAVLRRAAFGDRRTALSDRFVNVSTRLLPPLILAPGARLDFGMGGGIPAVPGAGWYLNEPNARWSDHAIAEIKFRWTGPAATDIPLAIVGGPLMNQRRKSVRVAVFANGAKITSRRFSIADDVFTPWRVDVPAHAVATDGTFDLLIAVESPTSPAALGMSGDYRVLSFFLYSIASPAEESEWPPARTAATAPPRPSRISALVAVVVGPRWLWRYWLHRRRLGDAVWAEQARRAPIVRAGDSLYLGRHVMGNMEALLGWHYAEPDGRWTNGTQAALTVLWNDPAAPPRALTIEAWPLLGKGRADGWIDVVVNGTRVGRRRMRMDDRLQRPWRVDLTDVDLHGCGPIEIVLQVDRAVRPCDLDNSGDARLLGCFVRRIGFVATPFPPQHRTASRHGLFRSVVPEIIDLPSRDLPPLELAPGRECVFGIHGGIVEVPGSGWRPVEPRARWSGQEAAEVRFRWTGATGASDEPIPLEIVGQPLMHGERRSADVAVTVNGMWVAMRRYFEGEDQMAPWRIEVPAGVVGADGALDLTISVKDPTSPAALGMSADRRILGYYLHRIGSPIGPPIGPLAGPRV